jgi:RNA polymerase sigma factor (sigma-70 family)
MHSSDPTDLILLQRIVARDSDALASLYDRHSRLLFGLILRIVRDRAEAEDILQEVFVRVWTRAELFDPRLGGPTAWLVRIARNRGSTASAHEEVVTLTDRRSTSRLPSDPQPRQTS